MSRGACKGKPGMKGVECMISWRLEGVEHERSQVHKELGVKGVRTRTNQARKETGIEGVGGPKDQHRKKVGSEVTYAIGNRASDSRSDEPWDKKDEEYEIEGVWSLKSRDFGITKKISLDNYYIRSLNNYFS